MKKYIVFLIFLIGLILCFSHTTVKYKAQPNLKVALKSINKPKTTQIKHLTHKKVELPTETPLVLEMANKVSHETGISPVTLGKIILAESGGDPKEISYNKNGSFDSGLFQINSTHSKEVKKMGLNLLDPEDNATFAIYLIKHYNLSPWNASRHAWE